jgi:hypothetical protein
MTEAELMAEIATEPVETPEETTEEEAVETSEEEVAENTEESTEETPENPYAFNLKVNGEEVEQVYESKEDLERDMQKFKASQQTFQDAAKLRGQSEKLMAALGDPNSAAGVLRNILGEEGLNELAQNHLSKQYDLSQMPERERDLYQQNLELKQQQEERDERLTQYEQEVEEHETAQDVENIMGNIKSHLPTYNLPDDPDIISTVADTMRMAMDRDVDLTEEQAVKIVADKTQLNMINFVKGATIENIVGLLGNDIVKKINRHSIDQSRTIKQPPKGSNYSKSGKSAANTEEKILQALTFEDVMQGIAQEAGI